jgi:CheY-like chemotaxis protein
MRKDSQLRGRAKLDPIRPHGLGHEVVLVHSGKEALEQLSIWPFDLVVTDHAMPHMTGAQLIAENRARAPGMPILLATGYAELPPGSAVGDVFRLS